MTLSDVQAYSQVLGSLIVKPLLLAEINSDIKPADFDTRLTKVIFVSVANLILSGMETLDFINVVSYIEQNSSLRSDFEKYNGNIFLQNAIEEAQPENFRYYFARLKKLSLLRKLQKENYDISYFYKERFDTTKEELDYAERLDEATLEEILNQVEGKLALIRDDYLNGTAESTTAAEGVRDLKEQFKIKPEFGLDLQGGIFNASIRGARLGKFYLRSAGTGVSKTRQAIFDGCGLAFPECWNYDLKTFVRYNREPQKTLFISTEMDASEVQTIMLAYLSGVNEEKILFGRYETGEEARVDKAVEIIEKYQSFFFIENISDPNVTNIRATVKKHVTVNNVQYIFYDYLFTSASIASSLGDSNLREDSALMVLSTALKDLAVQYNVFIASATQLNGK